MEATSQGALYTPEAEDSARGAYLEISARSRELLEVLRDRFKGDAHLLYESAMRVLVDKSNPARLPLAAAAVREIMDDLEREAGFAHRMPDWKERIAKLEKAWQVAGTSLDVADGGGFVKTLEEFFEEFHRVPSRRTLADSTICAFDPATRLPPPAVRDARADAWGKFRRYFNGVLHREAHPTDVDFHREFESFEAFLFDWLRPPTSADLDALDELLSRGPPDG